MPRSVAPSVLLMALVILEQRTLAIPPAEAWRSHRIYSENKQFCASITPDGKTLVKKVRRWWFDQELWMTPHYFEWAKLSDDGSFIVSSGGLVPPPFRKSQSVITIYFQDSVARSFPLGLFVKDLRKLKTTESSARAWGGPTELTANILRVEGCDGRVTFLNVKTGEVRELK